MSRIKKDESFWRSHLQFFIERHPDFQGEDEVYVPRADFNIALLFEGGVRIAGDRDSLSINFNAPDLAVLWNLDGSSEHIYRIPWHRLIGFDLILTAAPEDQKPRKADLIIFPGGRRT